VAALPTAVLQGAWVVRSRREAGPHGIREAGVYAGFADTLRMGGHTIIEWLVPLPYGETIPGRAVIAIVLLLLIAYVVAMSARAAMKQREAPASSAERASGVAFRACALLAICYVGVICASRLFADPGVPFDNRILSPFELLVSIVVAIAIAAWWRGRGVAFRAVLVAVLLGWVSLALYADYDTVSYAMSEGADFASSAWRGSPTLAWARDHAAHTPLYSNWPAAVYFHLHRAARELPEADDTALTAFADTLRSRHAVILAFDVPSPGLADPAALERALGLREIARLGDGRILGPPARSISSATR
jgi:hypothetical protein